MEVERVGRKGKVEKEQVEKKRQGKGQVEIGRGIEEKDRKRQAEIVRDR